MNIVLIGYRGTGKTTLGKRLAARVGRGFLDTDVMVTERAGRTIREIFEVEGEAGFRELEAAAVREAAGKLEHVIAVGGGAVLRAENVAALKAGGGGGKIVWLRADVETLHGRIAADGGTGVNRPQLAGGGIEEIRALLAVRTPVYRAAADVTVDVSGLSVEEAMGRLLALL